MTKLYVLALLILPSLAAANDMSWLCENYSGATTATCIRDGVRFFKSMGCEFITDSIKCNGLECHGTGLNCIDKREVGECPKAVSDTVSGYDYFNLPKGGWERNGDNTFPLKLFPDSVCVFTKTKPVGTFKVFKPEDTAAK